MIAARSLESYIGRGDKLRPAAECSQPGILSDIYREDTNIAIWRRGLTMKLQGAIADFLDSNSSFRAVLSTTPSRASGAVSKMLGDGEGTGDISENVAELVDMFCCLFDLREVGLRLSVLNHAMCPRFHVDRVPCRLVTTYHGAGTEWLPHHVVDQFKPEPADTQANDDELLVGQCSDHIRQLGCADVGLLKGTLWEGNEHSGLMHRSPSVGPGEKRLLLTMDFLS